MTRLKEIGRIIKVLRRVLLFLMVAICIGIGAKVIYNNKDKDNNNAARQSLQAVNKLADLDNFAEWGVAAEKLARKLDRPIFFSIKDNFRKEACSEGLIRNNFIYTELDPEKYPGDYMLLKALHCNIGEDINITCGVLSSKMYPILTTSNAVFETETKKEPSIKKMLIGIVNIYHENYNRFLKISQNFYLLEDIPTEYKMEELQDDSAKLSFMLDFGYHEKFKAAQLSESARLSFRNCTVEKYSPTRTRNKNVAYTEIIEKLQGKENLSFTERAFYTRALADYILIFRGGETHKNQNLITEFADEIILQQTKNGSFVIEGTKDTLKNAFALTLLSYSYKITKDEKYLKAIENFANFLESELKSHSTIPANFETRGIACAKCYVYLSRALLNAYIVSQNPKPLELTSQVLNGLAKNFKQLDSMTYEISEESSFAQYMNLCSLEDSDYTSTNGVLLQIYKDIQTLTLTKDLDLDIKNILSATINSPCNDINFDFSLRIAKYNNPLISINTLNKVSKNKKDFKTKVSYKN